ncbi:MAG: hypothetical protein IJ274_14855 [Lachnospiraceae bacterium]|nr:hypothetical protein [Lachnospiraceae bacterium]
MIKAEEFNYLNYIKKEELTGSDTGMRYMLKKSGDSIIVTIWPEPYCYAKTPEEKKIRTEVLLTKEGVEQARIWLNEQHEKIKELWG